MNSSFWGGSSATCGCRQARLRPLLRPGATDVDLHRRVAAGEARVAELLEDALGRYLPVAFQKLGDLPLEVVEFRQAGRWRRLGGGERRLRLQPPPAVRRQHFPDRV